MTILFTLITIVYSGILVYQYLSETGRLVLIESFEEVKKEIKISRRMKPNELNFGNGAALESIVNNSIGISFF